MKASIHSKQQDLSVKLAAFMKQAVELISLSTYKLIVYTANAEYTRFILNHSKIMDLYATTCNTLLPLSGLSLGLSTRSCNFLWL